MMISDQDDKDMPIIILSFVVRILRKGAILQDLSKLDYVYFEAGSILITRTRILRNIVMLHQQ